MTPPPLPIRIGIVHTFVLSRVGKIVIGENARKCGQVLAPPLFTPPPMSPRLGRDAQCRKLKKLPKKTQRRINNNNENKLKKKNCDMNYNNLYNSLQNNHWLNIVLLTTLVVPLFSFFIFILIVF